MTSHRRDESNGCAVRGFLCKLSAKEQYRCLQAVRPAPPACMKHAGKGRHANERNARQDGHQARRVVVTNIATNSIDSSTPTPINTNATVPPYHEPPGDSDQRAATHHGMAAAANTFARHVQAERHEAQMQTAGVSAGCHNAPAAPPPAVARRVALTTAETSTDLRVRLAIFRAIKEDMRQVCARAARPPHSPIFSFNDG